MEMEDLMLQLPCQTKVVVKAESRPLPLCQLVAAMAAMEAWAMTILHCLLQCVLPRAAADGALM